MIRADGLSQVLISRPSTSSTGYALKSQPHFSPVERQNLDSLAVEHSHSAWHPRWEDLTPELLLAAHDLGIRVNVWTCNEPDDLERLINWGVDAVITDAPTLKRQRSTS